MERISGSRPGSAWDKWHLAGYQHVAQGLPTMGCLEDEARAYVVRADWSEPDSAPGRVCQRAWLAGAHQAVRHSN